MNKEGSIILGIGGDNSDNAQGTFYEGAMTSGYPSDAIENQVQANIVSAGYAPASLISGPALTLGSSISIQAMTNGANAQYIAHNGSDIDTMAALLSSGKQRKQQVSFTVQSGNNGNCYSFESVDMPGAFIRHFAYKLYLDYPSNSARSPSTFNDDSTFCTQTGFTGSKSTAFRSYSYPARYWRRVNGGSLYIGMDGGPFAWDSANQFDQQASWTVANGFA